MNGLMFTLLILVSIFCVFVGRSLSTSILHPIILMLLMWIGFIFFPIFFWDTEYNWDYKGLIWIMVSILMTEFGALLIKNKIKRKEEIKFDYNVKYNWNILIIVIILGVIAFLLQLKLNGFTLKSFYSFKSIVNMNTEVAYQRYYGHQQTTIISQLLLVFVYLSALCGGYSYNFAKEKKQKILSSIIAFLPEIGMILFSNTKAGLISSVILWLSGWCLSYLFLNRKFPKIKMKSLFLMFFAFVLMIGVLYFVMLLRTGDFSKRMRIRIIDKLWVYALGQVVNFDFWFSTEAIKSPLQMGLNNYMAIFKDLGITERVQGVYTVLLPGYGNVFTAYRGLIMDFGIFGSLFFCFGRGALIQYCIEKISTEKIAIAISSCILISGYFWNIYGFIISPWIYNSYVLMIFTFDIFLLFAHKRIIFKGKK